MDDDESLSKAERWARLRFSVVGPLLASPPPPGQLHDELERLASKHWLHPTKDEQAPGMQLIMSHSHTIGGAGAGQSNKVLRADI